MIRKIAQGEWVDFEDKSLFETAVITRFLNNLRFEVDMHQNIVSHFDSSVDDIQINYLKRYFRHLVGHMFMAEDINNNALQHDITMLFFHKPKMQLYTSHVIVTISYDRFWEEYRIVGIRKMCPKRWTVLRTVFRVRDGSNSGNYDSIWRNNK
jgi:hypothetical protein